MLTDIDTNNYISFGAISNDGEADITLTINDKTMLNISAKGVPMLSVPLNQISGFVQDVFCPTAMSIYYKNTYLPQHFDSTNGRTCSVMVKALNNILTTKEAFISNWYFTVFKDGSAEKQGKRLWSGRYLMIIGCRLVVFRYPVSKKRGLQNIPLNVIDLTNALISRIGDCIVSISTHREYEFRFPSADVATTWSIELRSAVSRGISLFNDMEEINYPTTITTREIPQIISDNYNETSENEQQSTIVQSNSPSLSRQSTVTNVTNSPEHNSILHPLPSYIGTDSHSENTLKKWKDNKVLESDAQCPDSIAMSMYSWGSNNVSQLARQTDDSINPTPTKISSLSVPNLFPVMVAAGGSHALCVSDEGELFSWGSGDKGQLGLGDIYQSIDPIRIPSIRHLTVLSIACGGYHSVCLASNGDVFTWGSGAYGQLGLGLQVDGCSEPTLLTKLRGKEIVGVFCGQNHTVFLSSNGSVYACGNGYYGQLGLDQGVDYFSPVVVKPLLSHTITQVACGETFTLFLTMANIMLVTGMLEIDEETFDAQRELFSVPHVVPFNKHIIKICAGSRFALILADGSNGQNEVYFWHADNSLQTAFPCIVASLSSKHITDIACGMSHCIAFSADTNVAYSWGTNFYGELGTGTCDATADPTEVWCPEGEKYIQITAGNSFNIAMTLPLTSHYNHVPLIVPQTQNNINSVNSVLTHNIIASDGNSNYEIEGGTIVVKGNDQPKNPNQPSLVTPTKRDRNQGQFNFNTMDTFPIHERVHSVNSELTPVAVRKSTAFTPIVERRQITVKKKEDEEEEIQYLSRAERAAMLERQFQSIMKKNQQE